MAELGIFTSCLQIADTAVRLKQLWSKIRDGPKDVQELAEEVIINAEILGDIQQCHGQVNEDGPDSRAWRNCAMLFQKVAIELQQLTDELQRMLEKHKRTGPVRIYLKNSEFERRKKRFRRIQMLIITSQQAYSQLFAKQNFSRLLKELENHSTGQRVLLNSNNLTTSETKLYRITSEHDEITTNANTSPEIMQTSPRAYASTSSTFTLQLPRWLVRRSFEILVHRSNASWGITFRTYNRLGHDSKLFSAANSGDWTLVKHLFTTRQASPFDVDPWEVDLLSVAAKQFQVDACRMLLSQGLNPFRKDILGGSAIEQMSCSGADQKITSRSAGAQDVVSLFASLGSEAFFDDDENLLYDFTCCDVSFIQLLIQAVCPEYNRIDPIARINMAFSSDSLDVARMEFLLGNDMDLEEAFNIAVTRDLQYNHFDLLAMAGSTLGRTALSGEYNGDLLQIVRSIVTFEAQNLLSSSYCFYCSYCSALREFLSSYFEKYGWHPESHCPGSYNQHVTNIARLWIGILKNAGANLERYAAAERTVRLRECWARGQGCHWPIESYDSRGRHIVLEDRHIIGGPDIEDWYLFVVPTSSLIYYYPGDGQGQDLSVEGHDEYEMAGGFWTWAEKPESYNIPGNFDMDPAMVDEPFYSTNPEYQAEFGPFEVVGPVL